ncbi:hypothetical protein OAF09_00055 [bacterium]|nr:hypothetical protein [Rubripirellula sp.]MDB4339107.1 hypothetical protein [Rubripirellula sp.]MDB4676597.1 hypothetical protein [bacterium]
MSSIIRSDFICGLYQALPTALSAIKPAKNALRTVANANIFVELPGI